MTPQTTYNANSRAAKLALQALILVASTWCAEPTKSVMADETLYDTPSRPSAYRMGAVCRYWITETLATQTEFEFTDTPIKEVVEFIKQRHKFPIELDTWALENAGIATDSPININLKNVSLSTALAATLRPLRLDYVLEDERMVITPRVDLEVRRTLTSYQIADLTSAPTQTTELVAMLKTLTETRRSRLAQLHVNQPLEHSWQPPKFTVFRGVLCVDASVMDQRTIAKYLFELRHQLNLPETTTPHPLSTWQSGKRLDFSYLNASGRDLCELRPSAPFESISLSDAFIDSKTIHWLSEQTALAELDLSGTRTNNRSLEWIVRLKNLKKLNLIDTQITIESLPLLAQLPQLRHLQIGRGAEAEPPIFRRAGAEHRFSHAAVNELRKQLPNCTIDFVAWKEPETRPERPRRNVDFIDPFEDKKGKSPFDDLPMRSKP